MKINWDKISIKKLALLVSGELRKSGMDAVLVGGACVSIYTHNKYFSMDLDFVSGASLKELAPVMKSLGFKLKGRHFEHPGCRLLVEFPPPPVSIGNETPIRKFSTIKTLTLFTPTDCVKDRLAAYYHWSDPQSLKQAIMVARSQPIHLADIADWSKKEGAPEKFKRFETMLKKKSGYKTRVNQTPNRGV